MDVPPGEGEGVHEGVDAIDGLVLGAIGEVGVAGGGEDRVVAEDLLDLDQIDAGLDEVGGVAVTQAVGGDLFFIPQEAMT